MKKISLSRIFILLIAAWPWFSQAQQVESSLYKIYDVASQEEISLDQLIAHMSEVDVLFFGEEHNDSLGHNLQDSLYQMLLGKYGTVTLSMEMFETDCQQVLDEYLADYITESKLIKDARAWNNYAEDYKPMVDRAKRKGQVVIAANAPRRYVNLVSRRGLSALETLPKSAQQYLPPLPIYTDDEAYYQRFLDAMGGSGHGMGDNIYFAQCTWDASMAYQIFRHWKKHKKEKIFHLNGRFHTDYQQGTMKQLKEMSKKVRARNISCFPADDFDDPDWAYYAKQGDYIVIHPHLD
ncbi:MAG: ChaN family lipoprotein [Bacteroidota bacterium]